MVKDIAVGEEIQYYGYPIFREEESEYRVVIHIEWPIETVGRTRREKKNGQD